MMPEIVIVDEEKRSCFAMTNHFGDVYIPYSITDDGVLLLKDASFTDGIEENGLLYTMIKSIIDTARLNNFRIETTCIWIQSYLKLHSV